MVATSVGERLISNAGRRSISRFGEETPIRTPLPGPFCSTHRRAIAESEQPCLEAMALSTRSKFWKAFQPPAISMMERYS